MQPHALRFPLGEDCNGVEFALAAREVAAETLQRLVFSVTPESRTSRSFATRGCAAAPNDAKNTDRIAVNGKQHAKDIRPTTKV